MEPTEIEKILLNLTPEEIKQTDWNTMIDRPDVSTDFIDRTFMKYPWPIATLVQCRVLSPEFIRRHIASFRRYESFVQVFANPGVSVNDFRSLVSDFGAKWNDAVDSWDYMYHMCSNPNMTLNFVKRRKNNISKLRIKNMLNQNYPRPAELLEFPDIVHKLSLLANRNIDDNFVHLIWDAIPEANGINCSNLSPEIIHSIVINNPKIMPCGLNRNPKVSLKFLIHIQEFAAGSIINCINLINPSIRMLELALFDCNINQHIWLGISYNPSITPEFVCLNHRLGTICTCNPDEQCPHILWNIDGLAAYIPFDSFELWPNIFDNRYIGFNPEMTFEYWNEHRPIPLG